MASAMASATASAARQLAAGLGGWMGVAMPCRRQYGLPFFGRHEDARLNLG